MNPATLLAGVALAVAVGAAGGSAAAVHRADDPQPASSSTSSTSVDDVSAQLDDLETRLAELERATPAPADDAGELRADLDDLHTALGGIGDRVDELEAQVRQLGEACRQSVQPGQPNRCP